MRLGLRPKLIVGIMTIIFGIMGSMSVVLIEKMRDEARKHYIQRARMVSISLESLLNSCRTGDAGLERTMVSQLLQNTDVLSARFEDTNFIPLAVKNPAEQTGTALVNLHSAIRTRQMNWSIITSERMDSKRLLANFPISRDGEVVGGLLVLLSLDEMEAQFSFFWGSTIKFILVEYLVIIIFIGLLLSMMILRPIDRMNAITKRIAQGELQHRIEAVTTDELGDLAQALNTMSEKLLDNRKALEEHVSSLEKAYKALQRAQQEIIISEKLACVGQLAAGVAHEIGNPLSSILGYIELLTEDTPPQTQQEIIARSRREIARIERIIRGLLDFSRPASLQITAVSLTAVLDQTLPLIKTHKAFKQITISQRMESGLQAIRGDFNLIQQVLFNVLLNAAQAMEGKGQITLTANRTTDPDTTNPVIEVHVIDEGPGIPESLINKVMEPFYTTKVPGEGTGLGLTICHQIMEQLEGKIELTPRIDTHGLDVILIFKQFEGEPHGTD